VKGSLKKKVNILKVAFPSLDIPTTYYYEDIVLQYRLQNRQDSLSKSFSHVFRKFKTMEKSGERMYKFLASVSLSEKALPEGLLLFG